MIVVGCTRVHCLVPNTMLVVASSKGMYGEAGGMDFVKVERRWEVL